MPAIGRNPSAAVRGIHVKRWSKANFVIIRRVQVEEGFLHGLDLPLDYGLSVLIGARGSGKTSVIELIRFCLSIPSYTSKAAETALKQAREVLGAGKVTVTLEVDGEQVMLSRTTDETEPRRSSSRGFPQPIILSQSEIEQVGLQEDSRLRLLDGFTPSLRENTAAEEAVRALIASLTVELRQITKEKSTALEELERLKMVPSELEEARRAATAASETMEQASAERARLQALGQLTAEGSVRDDVLRSAATAADQQLQRLSAGRTQRTLDPWPTAAGSVDLLAAVRTKLADAERLVADAEDRVRGALGDIHSLRQDNQAAQLALEDEARLLRSHLEQLSEGAGLVMKRVSDLEAAQQRALALTEHAAQLATQVDLIRNRRDVELDRLDSLREERVNAREQAAAFLNDRLGPRIRVSVNRFGSVDDYAEAIADSLRGSGLQYNVLAPEIAPLISPRELACAAEADDAATIAQLTGIALDRAQRLAAHLREAGTESILTARLEDTTKLSLLDGGTYKPVEELSVGQRCTTVLPIILTHSDRVLIVDQPEDNLDNSFIADTLVKALRNRPSSAQFIFVSHNPNVPVLGEADCVILLASDGRRGDVASQGALDSVASVRAISDIMEGGREAFNTRVAFYATEYPDEQD